MNPDEARELLDALILELTMYTGGLVAFYRLDDQVVRHLVRTLEIIRNRFLRRIEHGRPLDGSDDAHPGCRGPRFRAHPAIVEFLRSLRR